MWLKSVSARWRRIAVVSLVAFAALGVIGVFAIPAAVRWGLETVASRELGRPVRVEAVSANPYRLRVTLHGLRIEGGPGETSPLLTVREASINASITSLFRRAPVTDSLAIDGLSAHIVRLGAQRFNFSDIIERLQSRSTTRDEPARFSLANIEVANSTLSFDDRVTGGHHAVTDMRVGIPFLSSLPTDTEIKVEPAFAARIDGAPVALAGETRPFEESHESAIVVKFDGLDLKKYLAFSPVKLDFEIPAGSVSAELLVAFRQALAARDKRQAEPARLLISGTVTSNDFRLAAPAGGAGRSLIGWKSLVIAIEEFEPLRRRLVLSDVAVAAPEVFVERERQSDFNWQRFVRNMHSENTTVAGAAPQAVNTNQPYAFTLKHASLSDGRVNFSDETVGRFEQKAVNVQLQAAALTTTSTGRGSVKLAGDIENNGAFSLDGELGLAPLAGRLKFGARDVRLALAARYLANVLDGTIDGSSDVDGILEIATSDTGTQLDLRDIALVGKDIRLRGPKGSAAELDIASLQLDGGALDLTGRRGVVDRLSIERPRLVVQRLADGAINWQRVARPVQTAAPQPKTAASASWAFRLNQLDFARGEVMARDLAVEPQVGVRLTGLTGHAKNIVGDGSEPAQFSLHTRFGSGGTLAAQGSARWDAPAATVRVDARNLDIGALRPYLASRLHATLASAELSGRGTIGFAQRNANAPFNVSYAGSARLSNLHLLDAAGENDLLRWQVFDLEGVDVKTGEGAPAIGLGKLTLSDFYARVIVSPQGRLNLADLLTRDDAPKPPGEAATEPVHREAAATSSDSAASSEPRPAIRVGAMEFVRGNINFTDNFIKPNYSANMTGLGGNITSLASDSAEPATMTLAGRIDDDAPVEITGKLNPLAPTLYLDIEGRTKGVDLPRLTPYSVKYAGYAITKGKLSMEVRYKVEEQKLAASNHLFLDQLTFGERVESPTATKLPVLLAVSLLKNSRGEIDINLPISGSLDDPKFSVGGIIVQVIVNLLTKIVTAPFALLASAFGGSEELGYVEFAPGLATLQATQLQRLDTLAKALNDRPALKLDIVGRVEPSVDAEGVRKAKYEAKLRAAKVRQMTRGGGASIDPSRVTIEAAERPDLIATLYADEKIAEKPRNFLGFAKSIPAPEMEQLILKSLVATPDDLRALATARAAAVRNRLESEGKVARDRLFLVEPKLTAEGIKDKGPPTRVDFALK